MRVDHFLSTFTNSQAGRYYSSKTSGENYPQSRDTSAASSPANTPNSESPPLLRDRHATPFRELTEEEALELRNDSDADVKPSAASGGGQKSPSRRRKK